jgi:DNA repair exonuclease SbcCD ATPase subunit
MVQVRELLFGAQLKDMEMRFRRQEERLLREISEVKDALRSRLDSLENFMKSEVNSLLNKLKEEREERDAVIKAEQRERHEEVKTEARERTEQIAVERRDFQESLAKEQRDRGEAVSKVTSDLAAANDNFERRASKLGDSIDNLERTLRELIMTETTEINDKIDEKYNDSLSILEKTSTQIRSDMVYRTHMSTMVTEMVAGLSKPWNIDVSPVDQVYDAETDQEEPPANEQAQGEQPQGDQGQGNQGDDQGNQW